MPTSAISLLPWRINNDGDNSDSVADNTLVIFMSDNGGPGGANNSEFDANGGLTGTKGSINEAGFEFQCAGRR